LKNLGRRAFNDAIFREYARIKGIEYPFESSSLEANIRGTLSDHSDEPTKRDNGKEKYFHPVDGFFGKGHWELLPHVI
jgi:hypothetical protein